MIKDRYLIQERGKGSAICRYYDDCLEAFEQYEFLCNTCYMKNYEIQYCEYDNKTKTYKTIYQATFINREDD